MAARTWFDEGTSLPPADRQILNRAGRLLEDRGVEITRLVLTSIRMAYRPGMSATDLAEACDPRD